ncbi:unnamed protein product [Vicia faba]|uniref:Uncharacterized protein n=1 Tax=Vicia faba TaxID=3906 RepID=A0AAV1A5S5_VICFA|nr:unnamed protein product [Vicia faba]
MASRTGNTKDPIVEEDSFHRSKSDPEPSHGPGTSPHERFLKRGGKRLELLFEDCVRWCVSYLEAVPWTEEEEIGVVNLIPFLSEEESKELVARVSPVGENACEDY